MTETNIITHTWKQAPQIRRMPVYNNVSVDQIVAFAIRDDGKLCKESTILDAWDDDEKPPEFEEIKSSLLTKLEASLKENIVHSWKRDPRYRVFPNISDPIMDTVVVFAVRDDDVLFAESGIFDYDNADEMKTVIGELLLKLNEYLLDKGAV